jgi:APA family basic amino acid/polyamine antiporter
MATTAIGEQVSVPGRELSWLDAVSVVLGIVIGSGVFVAPAVVAENARGAGTMLLAWVAGGALCLCGALCYAELATTYPHSGGEYVYLSRAYGRPMGFFFVWSRMAVVQTGVIAAAAYIFGQYAQQLLPLGPSAPLLYALAATVILTAMNALGLHSGRWTQNLLTVAKVLGILAIAVVGLLVSPSSTPLAEEHASAAPPGAFGLAMVFVLYTFGGWNEAAYIAGEVRQAQVNMVRVLVFSIVGLTALYLAVNLAYLKVLGLSAMRGSTAVAADTLSHTLGRSGSAALSTLVAISALAALNGRIFTGARAVWALGGDFRLFRRLAHWNARRNTPANAILFQGLIAIVLILLPGLGPRFQAALGSGFEAAVEYTAPVFWAFLLLTSLAVFILRWKDRAIQRPFRTPLYPLTAIVFSLMCAYMLYSSLAYTGLGALVGVAVLAAGVPLYLLLGPLPPQPPQPEGPNESTLSGASTDAGGG